ncbi:hypothetical protein BO82DRAFT_405672 [Aspergillus uvarum CBS 121591]|uniref:Hydrophobin n=1 Tax=Aspergillus uvarum CBS 121591 TaxID=1448315 RepID=A0A319BWB9_9EURO|nr:hypothetical protein BO82DRAFT_405672 [Aspergillus uvarum CBS 121591]PYH77976.1 hypothetical protein BO82DRAFT_405672 [Aspergillus uvarum CBS 121591]
MLADQYLLAVLAAAAATTAMAAPLPEFVERDMPVTCAAGESAKCCPVLYSTVVLGKPLTVGVGCAPLSGSSSCKTNVACCHNEPFVVGFLKVCAKSSGSSGAGSGAGGARRRK